MGIRSVIASAVFTITIAPNIFIYTKQNTAVWNFP